MWLLCEGSSGPLTVRATSQVLGCSGAAAVAMTFSCVASSPVRKAWWQVTCKEVTSHVAGCGVQEVRHSKVWAPSAREIVALENQVRDMSLQLSSQRQQWLAVTSCSPQPAATLAGLRGSPSLKLSHAAQQMLSPGSVAKGDALILDQSMDVQAKIEYLQKQVDSVIEVAAVLQQSRHEEGTPAPAAQPSVEV